MRVFAISDLHVDHPGNAAWVDRLSHYDHRDDVLILAGDVSDDLRLLDRTVTALARRFATLLFVPGNHDLWVVRRERSLTSFDKFEAVRRAVHDAGGLTEPFQRHGIRIVPLLSWYDYSFGQPCEALAAAWTDFVACRWPNGMDDPAIADRFLAENPTEPRATAGATVISFSHFMPRPDLLPFRPHHRGIDLQPVMGTMRLDAQLRRLGSRLHVYGHSHVHRTVALDGVTYVNNALGYPREAATRTSALRCVHES